MGRIDWRARRRSVELPGARVNYVEIGEGEPLLFVHGLSGCWQKLGLEGTMVVGNSMGSFIAVEAMAAFPQRFKRLVLVSAAGILNTWNSEERATVTGYAWKKLGPLVADRGREIVSRPRSRRLALAPFFRYPNKLDAALMLEQVVGGSRCPGFRPGAEHADPPRHPRVAGDDRAANADRLGPLGPGDPGRRGDQLPPPPAALAAGDLRAHRPPAPTGAAVALQRPVGRVPSW